MQAIASCGRKFFRYEDRVAWIERDQRGQLFLHNEWNLKRIYISRYAAWKGFHHGGTLHALVGQMVEFIRTGKPVRQSYFDAKHWGYGDDMQRVVQAAKNVGFVVEYVLCEDCDGQGMLMCSECGGDCDSEDCTTCGGEGEQECPCCDGAGQVNVCDGSEP